MNHIDRDAIYDTNRRIFKAWVEEASGGIFTTDDERFTGLLRNSIRIVRTDGASVTDGDHEVSGVLVTVFIPLTRKLDRRYKTVMSQTVRGLRFAEEQLIANDDELYKASGSRWLWSDRYRLNI